LFGRASFLLDESGVSHNDLHPGNVVAMVRNHRGELCFSAPAALFPLTLQNTEIRFIDFGKSSWVKPNGLADNNGSASRGAEVYMGPDSFRHSDGWSVLIMGYYMAGISLPWHSSSIVREVDIDILKCRCLLGDTFKYNEKSLQALADGSTQTVWRTKAAEKMDRLKWPYRRFMEELFQALVSNELKVLRDGLSVERRWSASVRKLDLRLAVELKIE